MNQFFKVFIAIFIGLSSITAQELEKSWKLQSSESVFNQLKLDDGEFSFISETAEAVTGDYIKQNNLLIFFHNDSANSIRKYKISKFTDSTLVLSNKKISLNLSSSTKEIQSVAPATTETIIPSQGFSVNSLWRGILGMVTLIFIAFLF